jgi:mannosyltransferase
VVRWTDVRGGVREREQSPGDMSVRTRRQSGPRMVVLPTVVVGIPAVTAFLVGLWQISARSFTEDEAATMTAARMPIGDLLIMLRHVDAVHGLYYVLIHYMLHLGSSERVARLPSDLACALAAGSLAALGARVAGPRAGLMAGLLYAVSPAAVAGAQTARPFESATALAVVTCYRFVIFAERGGRKNGAAYTVALSLTGWVDFVAMLVVVTNAVSLFWVPQWRQRRRGFGIAAAAALLSVTPLAAVVPVQAPQVNEAQPSASQLFGLAGLLGAGGLVTFATVRAGRSGTAPVGARVLAIVAVPWLLLPPVILALVSQFSPIWAARYLWFCVPALALLLVAALSRLPASLRAPAMALALVAVLAAQPVARPVRSSDDLRGVSEFLARNARPGDAVVFQDPGRRLMKAAYPTGFAKLRDIALDASPQRTGLFQRDASYLHGRAVSQAVLARRLVGVQRIWSVRYAKPPPPDFFGIAAAPHAFCAWRSWHFPGAIVTLYLRCAR